MLLGGDESSQPAQQANLDASIAQVESVLPQLESLLSEEKLPTSF